MGLRANLYIAYARDNLNQAIDLASSYIERPGPSGAATDAHLFNAAALARTRSFDEADAEIRATLEVNPIARRSLRYGIMLVLGKKWIRDRAVRGGVFHD